MRFALILAVALTGCATALHHELQEVPVASTPPGAVVHLDCGRGSLNVGTTPMTLVLRRHDICAITMSKAGWQDAVVHFHRGISPATFTNVLPAAIATGVVSVSHVTFGATSGTQQGGTVAVSASGSGYVSPAVIGAIVLSGSLLIDYGSGALFEQSPPRVDIKLHPAN